VDPTLKTIIEFRDEMREFRTETRSTLGQHSHRLNAVEATLASLKLDVASLKVDTSVLLGSVPVQDERLDRLEARVAALEADQD